MAGRAKEEASEMSRWDIEWRVRKFERVVDFYKLFDNLKLMLIKTQPISIASILGLSLIRLILVGEKV